MGCYYTLVPFMCPQYNNLSNNLHFYIVIFTYYNEIPRKRHKSATNLHFGAGDCDKALKTVQWRPKSANWEPCYGQLTRLKFVLRPCD